VTSKSPIVDFPASTPSNAFDWIARLRAGDVTAQERIEFENWLAADPANRETYEKCERISAWPQRLQAQPELLQKLRSRLDHPAIPLKRPGKSYAWPVAIAATLAAVAFALAVYPRFGQDGVEIATRKGEQRTVALDDGSTIQLNTGSEAVYRLTAAERRVELKMGEAFFDVAKDSRRPFIVRAGKTEVRVLGTQFSVRQIGDRVDVVVKEGRVSVTQVPQATSSTTPPMVELVPGNLAHVESQAQAVRISTVDLNQALSWRAGIASFDSTPLEDAVAELNRYGKTPFVIEDQSLREVRISGQFRVGDVESIRFMLRESFGVESSPSEGKIQLRAAAR
jgi:transmembrane sensor